MVFKNLDTSLFTKKTLILNFFSLQYIYQPSNVNIAGQLVFEILQLKKKLNDKANAWILKFSYYDPIPLQDCIFKYVEADYKYFELLNDEHIMVVLGNQKGKEILQH